MKTRTTLFTIALIFALPALTTAQVGNLLRNKAAKVINAGVKTLNNEADTAAKKGAQSATENALDKREQNRQQTGTSAEEGTSEPGGRSGGGGNFGGLLGGKVTAKYNESYSFNNRMYMQMEIYDKKDVVKMDYFIYFSDNSQDAGIESKMVSTTEDGEQVSMITSSIFDGANKIFLLLTDMGSMKMGIISEVPDETTVQEQPSEKTVKPTITKTGNSKMIAGYKCDEYLYKDNESKDYGKLWVTKDLKLKGDNRVYLKSGLPGYYGDPQLEGGAVLAMESYNEKNELEMKSETKEINMGISHQMSTAGYSLRQMNFNQAGGKK